MVHPPTQPHPSHQNSCIKFTCFHPPFDRRKKILVPAPKALAGKLCYILGIPVPPHHSFKPVSCHVSSSYHLIIVLSYPFIFFKIILSYHNLHHWSYCCCWNIWRREPPIFFYTALILKGFIIHYFLILKMFQLNTMTIHVILENMTLVTVAITL